MNAFDKKVLADREAQREAERKAHSDLIREHAERRAASEKDLAAGSAKLAKDYADKCAAEARADREAHAKMSKARGW